MIHDHSPSGNPIDLTFDLNIDTLSHDIPKFVLESGEVDGLVIHGVMRKGYFVEIHSHIKTCLDDSSLDALLQDLPPIDEQRLMICTAHGKPLAVSSFFDRDDDYTTAYQDNGIPVFDAPEKAAGAMAAMYRHLKIRRRPAWSPAGDSHAAGCCKRIDRKLPTPGPGQSRRIPVQMLFESLGTAGERRDSCP